MKINFVLPFVNWTGGIRVVFEYAERLQARGHDVVVYYPLLPYLFSDHMFTMKGLRRWTGDLRLNLRKRKAHALASFSVPLVMAPLIANRFIRKADATIATAWPTAYSVGRLTAARGSKFYLVQHHETWSGSPEAVCGSYKLPLKKIVIATWLRDLIQNIPGQSVVDTITNGVDCSQFFPEYPLDRKTDRVLMQYSTLRWKGIADGVKAWDEVRRECPQAQLVMFGLKRGTGVPPDVEFHEDPSQDKLRGLYSSCDVFVSPSWTEGCQLPPMEAMACGCAVVATNVGGVPDYAVADKTALVVNPHDVEGLARAVVRLLLNGDERSNLARAGYDYIQQFTWDRAVDRFESALARGIASATD